MDPCLCGLMVPEDLKSRKLRTRSSPSPRRPAKNPGNHPIEGLEKKIQIVSPPRPKKKRKTQKHQNLKVNKIKPRTPLCLGALTGILKGALKGALKGILKGILSRSS